MRRADDNVVEHFDLEQLTGPKQVTRDLYVGLRWGRVARGVTVRENECMPRSYQHWSEYFMRIDGAGIKRAQSHQIMAQDSPPGIEDHYNESFLARVEPVGLRDVFVPVRRGLLRRFN